MGRIGFFDAKPPQSVISTEHEGSREAGDWVGVERSRGCILCHADTRCFSPRWL